MQKVPRTLPSEDNIGLDQDARSPRLNAASRCSGTSQSGSVAMSETMTADPRYAAVPHEPAQGPIGSFSISALHPLGRLGPATESKWVPSERSKKTGRSAPLRQSSIIRQREFRISSRATPVAIIS